MQKRVLAIMLVLALCLPAVGIAAGSYIVPHSNTRELTKTELWEWSYESLGFILNEIFARHGYNFIPGEKYHHYFYQRAWYTPNANPDNQAACYSQLSSLEWRNEHLVKEVRAEMRALGTFNSGGKHYLDYIEDAFDVLSGFTLVSMKPNQRLPIYAAPSRNAYRGANGKALVSTNGDVYAAGFENGWLLVMYATNNGAVRVGYVSSEDMKDRLTLPMLTFMYQPVTLAQAAYLTDDPATSFSQICALPPGTQVTYLTGYQNRMDWAYVETTADGKPVRGFIPTHSLNLAPIQSTEQDWIGTEK